MTAALWAEVHLGRSTLRILDILPETLARKFRGQVRAQRPPPPTTGTERAAKALNHHVRLHSKRLTSEWIERDPGSHRILPVTEATSVSSRQGEDLVVVTVADQPTGSE